jgi:hypothetical protein
MLDKIQEKEKMGQQDSIKETVKKLKTAIDKNRDFKEDGSDTELKYVTAVKAKMNNKYSVVFYIVEKGIMAQILLRPSKEVKDVSAVKVYEASLRINDTIDPKGIILFNSKGLVYQEAVEEVKGTYEASLKEIGSSVTAIAKQLEQLELITA